ncbi:MAG: hydroxyacylglutathione hydrolase [Chitinophagaceae bacterium]|nr:hydroxyacylglutathione hydrolase [Oligoflexus sp.]
MDYSYKTLELFILPLRTDNYSYIIHDKATRKTLVIDPSETAPILSFLKDHAFALDLIIDTHHHDDHTQGNIELQKAYSADIAASVYDIGKERIPGHAARSLKEGETLGFGAYTFHIINTPGHTLGHMCLFLEGAEWLFSGDTLFALGSGRLFEGTPSLMWSSFLKLRHLPDTTLVFCGHEYTLSNARFAQSLPSRTPALDVYVERQTERKNREGRTIPSRLGDEKLYNPFLRADAPEFAQAGLSPEDIFGEIRKRKDNFS